jgi:hypothetical protein
VSPVAPSSGHASKALLLAVGAIVVGMAALYGASVLLTNRHNGRAPTSPAGGIVSLGTTKHLAQEISDGAQPVFFPDSSGNNLRAVYVQHSGPDRDTGWTAFLAQVPGAANDCLWQWNATTRQFDASCDHTRHAPADGAGLETYPVVVADGHLKIDFRTRTTTTINGG